METGRKKRRRHRRGPTPRVAYFSCVVLGLAGAGLVYMEGSIRSYILSGIAVVYIFVMIIINERRGFASGKKKYGDRLHHFNEIESATLIILIMLNAFVDARALLR